MPRNAIIPYNPRLKPLARELRKNGTLAEVLLWREIKGKTLGCEFHRQTPIGEYIVDFYCHELRLAIEIDGSSHESPTVHQNDLERQARLESLGVSFLRVADEDVKRHLGGVVESICTWIEDNASAESGRSLPSENIPLDPPSKGDLLR